MSDLTTGGPNANLPEGWVEPAGYPLTADEMLWVKDYPASENDVKILTDKGFKPQETTLVGTLHPEWTAPQYNTPDEMEPWDTFPMYGGRFSAHYKFQHLPEGVVTAHPRWWIHENGKATRAKGGEPVTRVDLGDAVYEYHVVDIEITWDEELGVWRT